MNQKNVIDFIFSFVYLANNGSLRAAAKEIGISHTSVQQNIRELESLLEVRLFDKINDRFILTENGKKLQKLLLPISEATNLDKLKQSILENSKGKIAIYAYDFKVCMVAMQVAKNLFKKDEKFTIFYNSLSKEELFSQLANHQIDVAFFPIQDMEILKYKDFKFTKVADYKIAICYNSKHPLNNIKKLSFQEIAKYQILKPSNDFIVSNLSDILKGGNISHDINVDTDNLQIIEELISKDFGISFFEYRYIKHFNNLSLKIRNVTSLFPRISSYAITRKEESDAQAFKPLINLVRRGLAR